MESMARRDILIAGAVVLAFGASSLPALLHARQEVRDGIRRDEIAAFKSLLEQYYNEHEAYPLEFDASPHTYVVTERNEEGVTEWYIRAQLENQAEPTTAYDAEAGRNYHYRIRREGEATYYEVCGGAPACPLE